MDITMVGLDIAKSVFQLCGVNARGKTLLKKRLTRKKLLPFIATLKQPCCIVMEACGGANHWAREFTALGFEVKLIAPQFVKPFVKSNKNDERDAQAITEAASRPDMRFITPKNLQQQDWQSLVRVRSGTIDMRTKLCNQIRGLLAEYGIVASKGVHILRKSLPFFFDREADNGLTPAMKELIESQYTMLLMLDQRIAECDIDIKAAVKASETCQRLMTIPGIGDLSALTLVATVGNGSAFKNGRHLSAFLGLVPRQHSSGNQQRLMGISKRGNPYLRSLLIHGARAVFRHVAKKEDQRSLWIKAIAARSHTNNACVALANKNARVALAILHSGDNYREVA